MLFLGSDGLIANVAHEETVKSMSPRLPNMLYPILRDKSVTLVLKLFISRPCPLNKKFKSLDDIDCILIKKEG